MAREEKRFELRPVEDEENVRPTVLIRLQSEGALHRTNPTKLGVPAVEDQLAERLPVPSRDEVELRTHQPGIEALIETDAPDANLLEANWGAHSSHHRSIPWGWFVLIGLLLAGGVIWSLTRVNEAGTKTHKIRIAAENVLTDEENENHEAAKLVDTIHDTTRKFFEATTIDSLLKFVRQPDRVRPLMELYFADKPFAPHPLREFQMLQPVSLGSNGNYWMATVELDNRVKNNLLLEILPSGKALVDWEALVCYQPMKWDDFATKKPRGTSLNFRVYVEQENFFSHEFADSNRWNCFRLTALDSDETLFGYARSDSPLSQEILGELNRSSGHKASMILRLVIPEGILSHNGVVIEKLMSPRWFYLDPPESGF